MPVARPVSEKSSSSSAAGSAQPGLAGGIIQVEGGESHIRPAPPAARGVSPFDRDRFLLRQKHLSLTETYRVFDEQDEPVLFVKREGHHLRQIGALLVGLVAGIIVLAAGVALASLIANMVPIASRESVMIGLVIGAIVVACLCGIAVGVAIGPKRHIGFFRDQTMSTELLRVFQDQKFAFINATFTVADPDLNLVGWLHKNYLYNVVRKRWYIHDADGQMVCLVLEDSIVRSILRRVFRGTVIDLMLRTNFIFLTPDGSTKLGEFNRRMTLLDKYVLDLSADRTGALDRRLALAMGVLLDTAEKR